MLVGRAEVGPTQPAGSSRWMRHWVNGHTDPEARRTDRGQSMEGLIGHFEEHILSIRETASEGEWEDSIRVLGTFPREQDGEWKAGRKQGGRQPRELRHERGRLKWKWERGEYWDFGGRMHDKGLLLDDQGCLACPHPCQESGGASYTY